ncbi:hypothetical protein KBB27_04035 [Patescibacteria group bacterium]|nr:hypothetical protein [Patescibacteria group bacterium]
MTKRAAIVSIIMIVGVVVAVLLINRGSVQKPKVDSVATCIYDPSKTEQSCACPFVSEGEKATTTCLIHDARGSLKIVDDRATDGVIHLVLTDANGVAVNTPPINSWTGYGVKQIQKEYNGSYFVELASQFRYSEKPEHDLRRYLRVSFSPKPNILDMSLGSDLSFVRYQGKDTDEEGNVYGFIVGKNISKPIFVLTKINTHTGSMEEIADLTTSVKASGLLKQLEDPYTYSLNLSEGYNGRPFFIEAIPYGMTDEPSRYYEVDVIRATLKQVKQPVTR